MRIFTYGSLMSGYRANQLLWGSRYLGRARVDGLAMVDLGAYPMCYPDPERHIWGEVYEINRQTLRALDRYENGIYDRQERLTSMGPALVYVGWKLEGADGNEIANWGAYEFPWDREERRKVPRAA